MYCHNCGTQIPDTVSYCPECGAKVASAAPAAEAGELRPVMPAADAAPAKKGGMGWFKFIIYFQLFAAAVVSLFNAFTFLSGTIYGSREVAENLYYIYPEMKLLTMALGVVSVALAVFAIVVRFSLARYKRSGPRLYLILLAVNILVTLVFVFGAAGILESPVSDFLDSTQISSLVVSLGFLIFNFFYFRERKELFVN
jgi:hypothetical protein